MTIKEKSSLNSQVEQTENIQKQSFIDSLKEFFLLSPEVAKICTMQFFTWIGMMCLMLAIYWIGAYLISNAQMFDKLTIFSDMIVFTQYAMQVVMSFMMLVMIFVLLPRASVSAKRINEVLDMGKLESGEVVLEEKSFHLQELLNEVLTVIEKLAQERGIEVIKRDLSVSRQHANDAIDRCTDIMAHAGQKF